MLFSEKIPNGENTGPIFLTLKQLEHGATSVTAKCTNDVNIISLTFVTWGHEMAQLVQVAGSIPDVVTGIFH